MCFGNRLLLIIGTAALLIGCQKPSPQVFGVSMGTPLSSLKKAKPVKNSPPSSWYEFVPSEPSSFFQKYQVFVTPKRGACALTAQSIGIDEGGHPIEFSEFNIVLKAMTEKYGKPISASNEFSGQFARQNYSWNKVRYVKVPDIHTVEGAWHTYNPNATLPDEINDILLSYFPGGGEVEVFYNFKNWDDCVKEAQTSGL